MLRVLLKFWFVDKFIWCVFCKCEYIERRMIERVLYLIYYKRVAWAWAYCTVAGQDRAVARNQVLDLPSCSWQLSVGHLLGLFFINRHVSWYLSLSTHCLAKIRHYWNVKREDALSKSTWRGWSCSWRGSLALWLLASTPDQLFQFVHLQQDVEPVWRKW